MAAIVAERELALARAAEAGERRHATARVLLEQEIGRVAVRRRKLVQVGIQEALRGTPAFSAGLGHACLR